jgi:acetyltransferase
VFLCPAAVAVFGATEAPGSVGRAVMTNLIRNPFGGVLFPVNPTRRSVLGIRAYRSLAEAPAPAELAVVATPAATVPGVVAECAAAGVRAAIVLSAGFSECGPAGAKLEQELGDRLRPGGMRVLGPNSIGVVSPATGINATFAPGMVRPGGVGYVSQSGSLLSALTGAGPEAGRGCSAFLSVGGMIDVGWADCLAHLGDDPHTRSIGVFVESVGDAPTFFAAVRAAAARKPVVVLPARRADVPDEAFGRAGALRVHTLADLFRMTELLAARPGAAGRRLAIVSNAAGPALLAADAVLDDGCELATLSAATVAALDRLLPRPRRHHNPIDVGDDAGPECYARAVAAAARDPNSDGVLAILTPQVAIDPVRAAEPLAGVAAAVGKPVLAVWLWAAASPDCQAVFDKVGIPVFSCPDAAVRTFGYLWRHGTNPNNPAATPGYTW